MTDLDNLTAVLSDLNKELDELNAILEAGL